MNRYNFCKLKFKSHNNKLRSI